MESNEDYHYEEIRPQTAIVSGAIRSKEVK
jgi:hypothetical protein